MSKDPNTQTAAQNVKPIIRRFGWKIGPQEEVQVNSRHGGRIALVYSRREQNRLRNCLISAGLVVKDYGGYLEVEA